MIDLTNTQIIQNNQNNYSVELSEFICISALTEKYIDSRVVSITGNSITIEGKFAGITNVYATVKGEIVYITSSVLSGENTVLEVQRAKYNTVEANIEALDYFRTVDIFLETKDYTFTEEQGNLNNVFDLSLNEGSVILNSNPKYWDIINESYKYLWKPKKNYVYYFKGIKNQVILKNTNILKSVKTNVDKQYVKVEFRDKMYLYWDLNLNSSRFIKNLTHKDFLSSIFNLEEHYIRYANNLTDNDFDYIRNVQLSNYNKFSSLILDYIKSGVRISFDRFENILLYSDKYIGNLDVNKVITGDYIKDLDSVTNERLVFNTVNSDYTSYDTIVNFESIGSKFVNYLSQYDVNNFQLLTDSSFNILTVTDSTVVSNSYLEDSVVLKNTSNGIEVQGIVIAKENNSISIAFNNSSKNSLLNFNGKITYFEDLGFSNPSNWVLHYKRKECPIIWKVSIEKDSGSVSENMAIPILPKVVDNVGKVLSNNTKTYNAKFGSATNLIENVQDTGAFENIDGLFGKFTQEYLHYNAEIEQFNNKKIEQFNNKNPPIMLLSNRILSAKGNINSLISYDTWDNRNIEIEVLRTANTSYSARVNIQNTVEIEESDLFESTYKNKVTNRILEIDSEELSQYNVGDVLVVKKPNSFDTLIDKVLYEDTLSTIKWTIKSITTEDSKYYLWLDTDFPDDYSWIRYPSTSIVYLQSLYFRGNPVVKRSSSVEYTISTDSIEIYEKQPITINTGFLDREGFKKLVNYYSYFIGTNASNTKQIKTFTLWGHIDLEIFDIITLKDKYIIEEDEDNKYVILSITHQSTSNGNIQLIKCMNLNTASVVEEELQFQEDLVYEPVNIANGYNPSGNEGNLEDTTLISSDMMITANDKDLGNYGLLIIDPSLFYGKIDSVVNNVITFNSDFYGTNRDAYSQAIFSDTGNEEFVINIEEELIYCISIPNQFKATILKRGFITGNQFAGDLTGRYAKFYEITNQMSEEDGFVSNKAYIGDQFNYLKFERLEGLEVNTIGNINFSNPYNQLRMDKNGTISRLLLEVPKNNWGNLTDDIKFQIGGGSGLGSTNYIRYSKETGLEIEGIIALNSDTSYISFDGGMCLKSVSAGWYSSGFEFSDNTNGMYFYSSNYPNDTIEFTLKNNRKKFSLYSDAYRGTEVGGELSFEWLTASDVYITQALKINGLTIGNETANPIGGTVRINSGKLQVYYNSTWQTIFTFA